jgi:DNA-binding transcriptional regulator LsrR (DeoR family)
MRIRCASILSICFHPLGRAYVARLNIYLPDDLHELASRWRKTVNLSEICTRALREELSAAESSRSMINLHEAARIRSDKEQRLINRFHLVESIVVDASDGSSTRNELGIAAANFVDQWIRDGSILAITGGRQTWAVVRNLKPRNVRVDIAALGFGQLDPIALHTHPNTLLTLTWLLYAPRATAHLVGSQKIGSLLSLTSPVDETPKYFVLASCGPFMEDSPLAGLLGASHTKKLLEAGAVADFAYLFFDRDGQVLPPKFVEMTAGQSVLTAESLQSLSRRPDSRVILIAGSREKAPIVNWAVKNKLCNTLVVDSELANQLSSG